MDIVKDENQLFEQHHETFRSSESEDKNSLPMIPMRGMTVFPGMVIHFDIGRKKSINALEQAMTRDQIVFLTEQKDPTIESPEPEEIYEVGCIAKVKQMLKMPDNLTRILVEVEERAKIVEYVRYEPYFEVAFEPVNSIYYDTKENRALIRMIREAFSNYMNMTRKMATDLMAALELVEDPDQFINLVCANLNLEDKEAQRILQETNIDKRLMVTYEVLINEIEMLQIEQNIEMKVKSELDKNQKEYVLREQIKVIQEELGDTDVVGQIEKYRERLAALDVSDEVREKAENEINRLNKLPQGSAESGVIEAYIEWILDLPWNKTVEETA